MRYDKNISKVKYFNMARAHLAAYQQLEREYDFLNRQAKKMRWQFNEIIRILNR